MLAGFGAFSGSLKDFGPSIDAFVYRNTRMGRHATGIDSTGSRHLESR